MIAVAVYLMCKFRFGTAANPIGILALWWLLWLAVAHLSLFYVEPPSAEVTSMTLLMVGSFLLGALLTPRPVPSARHRFYHQNYISNTALIVATAIPLAFVLLFWYVQVRDTYVLGGMITREQGLEAHNELELFGKYRHVIIDFGIKGLLVVFIVCGATALAFGRYWLFGASVLVAYLSTLPARNRFPIYAEVGITILTVLIVGKWRRVSRKAMFYCVVAISMFGGIFFVTRTLERINKPGLTTPEYLLPLISQAVNYHTLGFALMTRELQNESSMAHTRHTYGRAVLGGLDDIFVTIVVRRVDNSSVPANLESFRYRDSRESFGGGTEYAINANAFYTVLHTLYLDGKWLGVAIFPIAFGILLARSYWEAMLTGSEYSFAWVAILLFIGITSLFESALEDARYWVAMGVLFLIGRVSMYSLGFVAAPIQQRWRIGKNRR